MEPIKAAFEAEHNCRVRVSYAGSGTLLGQLQAGSPADLYLPGDSWYVDRAAGKGLVASRRVVAWFVPVVAVQKGNPKGVSGLEDLARIDLKVGLGKADACAIGNVSAALVREYDALNDLQPAFEALTVNRLANQVKLKAVDAAIIWDAAAMQYPDSIDVLPIEDGDFHAVPLAVAVLKAAAEPALAEAFADFMTGNAAVAAFSENHYRVPGRRLRIGCGASMRPPVEELAALFERKAGCRTFRNYGGSGTVLLQIEESKEGDIYICHDPFAYTCEAKGLSERWHTVAHLQPALAVARGNPKHVRGFRDLLREDLKLGLPHRKRSTRGVILWEMLERAGMAAAMTQRKFFESRTHDLVNQLKLGAVDVAVLWDAPVKAMPELEAVAVEPEFHVDAVTAATSGKRYSLEQVKVTVVRLTFSQDPLLAAQFARLCLSEEGRAILARHHFTLP